ncbi:hypothetical protein BGZ91_007264 [Linnemannia elongata]|nr:hypothetical protein BGZ91_007264 [Linnemannia elongata]
MASSIRAISMSLPRVSMARIPLVAFTNTHVAPTLTSQAHAYAHANSTHPSAYSSMPTRSNSNKYTNAADKLEQSAKNMNQSTKDYLRERQVEGTFEETLWSDIQADVAHPAGNEFHHADHHHEQELISSLCEELKEQPSATSSSRLSQHASDAIRMVESHSILKQDKAPVHNVRDEDPAEKVARYQKRH